MSKKASSSALPVGNTTGGSTLTCVTILFVFEGKEHSTYKIEERMHSM
jgi:hypothetical protein